MYGRLSEIKGEHELTGLAVVAEKNCNFKCGVAVAVALADVSRHGPIYTL